MQVTATTLFVSLPVTTATKTTEAGSAIEASPASSILPMVNNTADQVSIQQRRELPLTYDNSPVIISGLRDSKPKEQAASAISQNLLSSLNAVGAKKATLSVSSIFSQIGALSRETLEYRNEARRVQVTQEMAVKNPTPNFSLRPSSDNQTVNLSIKTKEGDTIQIELAHRNLGADSATLEFSFTVDGSLSEAEQKALGELAEKLGQMGDEFFRSDTTELRNLKGIDTSVISSFSFTLKRPDREDKFVEQSYEFSVDDTAQTQTLRASDVRGYSVDITTNLKALVENSTAEASRLEPYLKLIREATDDAKVDNKSRRFMLDAFESMFAQFIQTAPIAAEAAAETTLAAFDTGLPDFQASIRSKVIHNRAFYTQASVLALTMTQETRVETSADTVLIKQESRYELTNNRFEGVFDLSQSEIDNPNYTYITEHREGNINRVLSMTADRVNNLLVEQNVSREKETSVFRNYKQIDSQSDDYTDRQLQQFSDVLLALNNNKQYVAINELLEMSKQVGFL